MPLQCSPYAVAARAFVVMFLQAYCTKQLVTKWVPHDVHAQCNKWSQLFLSLFTECGAREPEHGILANLLSPHSTSQVVAPIYILTNSVLGFPFLHNLSSICYLWT